MTMCSNCTVNNATVQVRDMKGNLIPLCDSCAKRLKGAMVLKLEQ